MSKVVNIGKASPVTLPAFEMLDALPDPVMGLTSEGLIVYCNIAAESFLGQGRKAVCGRSVGDFFTIDLQPQTLRDLQVRGQAVDRLVVTPVADGFLLTLYVPPAHLKTQWAEKSRAALKPAQLIARTLAHEIKNPLAGISGAAQLLGHAPLSQDDRELLTLISRETERIGRLVDKVNVFEDAPQHLYQPLNIHEVTGRAVALTRAALPDIDIAEKYDPSLPDITGHADHLVQVFVNMLKNAAEAGADKIIVRSFYDTAAAYHPLHHRKLPFCLEIEDNGRGMDEETRQRLFELYYTTKSSGSGFGLALVSKIIDDHGGVVDVTSRPQKTVFRISLPLEREK